MRKTAISQNPSKARRSDKDKEKASKMKNSSISRSKANPTRNYIQ